MRVLPATLSPFPGETVRSLYNRLVERNSLTAGELWTAIRKSKQGLPLRTTPEAAPDVVARLDDLPANWFDREDTTNRLFSRCIHNNWAHAQCARCSALPKPVTMCRRCASGMKVEVQSRAGAFCARHERWHYDGRDEAIGIPVAYARAERCLTGTLWARGIGLDTGEIELACEIISTYREFVDPDNSTRSADQRLRDFYPDAVELTAFLTAPSAQAFLRNRQIGHLPVAAMVEAAATAVASRSRHRLSSVHGMFQASGRELRLGDSATKPLRHGRPLEVGALGGLVRDSVPRIRAVFLRHDDARRPLPTLRDRPPRHR
ncbi:hypothetical protein QYR02_09480 [Microbacterium maritypicum]|uniref:hypothetical protein n=1 Tax=Microbacterium maritypicum TaxID=33918 RepID=UPI002673F2CC|nr:hypothetical protein [Microbacterium liquefaciens]WKT87693.1 hypothetical protein QYR02_09480 [Microbacterium liquefaciens]